MHFRLLTWFSTILLIVRNSSWYWPLKEAKDDLFHGLKDHKSDGLPVPEAPTEPLQRIICQKGKGGIKNDSVIRIILNEGATEEIKSSIR